MKRALVLVITLALMSLALAADTSTMKATFLGIEQGDYFHLNVKDDKGEERSFWISSDDSFKPFLDKPESYAGKKVEVTWHRVKREIPEAGGEMEIDEAVSIRLLK